MKEISPSDPPKVGPNGKVPQTEKDDKSRNGTFGGINATVSTSSADGREHKEKRCQGSKKACEYLDKTLWFFSDPSRALAFLTVLLVVVGIGALCIQRDTEERQLRAYMCTKTGMD